MSEPRRYPSDLSDARWELVQPVLTAWRAERRGRGLDIARPPDHDLRILLDAVLYVNRTSIPWRYLPHDYPPWPTVYAYFAHWQEEGVFDQLNTLLRRQVRQREGRETEPSACVIDSQSIKTSTNVPTAGQGTDAGKKIVGRPTVCKTWVDGGYRQHLVEHAATLGIDMHIVRRNPTTRGFTVLPRRWTVERTLGWLMQHRRLARDYEAKPHRSEAIIHLAMINLMTRRLTGESTPTWRGT
ncbi:transposase [Streptomyces sp. NPDC059881]|uniref:transposase n=1 Tax=Streptomyces sp. NPDC059881 TaxID=3346986 RepID=UPI003663C7DE